MAGRDQERDTDAQAGAAEDAFDALLRDAVRMPALGLPASEPAQLLEGRFRIERRLGEGGMGVVYQAYDALRHERVALKTLTRLEPAGIYRLKQEFRSLSHVAHPNLVALHELFRDRDRWFFTMDHVEGVELTRYCAERPDDEASLQDLMRQLLSGVWAIHQAGKLHRDLKPSNVLVSPQGRVLILDFGLVTDQALDASGPTSDGALPGTPAYMAPEQAAGEAATPKSDLYAG
jgi:serine/threonine protein kinase